MKEREEILDIYSMERNGFSQRAIAKKLGISRQTVKKYLKDKELIFKGKKQKKRGSKLDAFDESIISYIREDEKYTARWIYEQLCAKGFAGSYEIVKRKVGKLKQEEQRIAYTRFETDPGVQAQVDFGEFQIEGENREIKKVYVFSMILGYSRGLYAEIIESCDLPTFLDCHINAFKYFNGVPQEILYDRMKNVYIGKIAGKSKFNESLVGFALHYGFTPKVAPAYAPWVKGKVERPYRYIRENFWRGYNFSSLKTAQKDLVAWLKLKEERVHGTTHEVVAIRLEREKAFLKNLPLQGFDTSYRIYREVHKDCTVYFEANQYVVPHKWVGHKILLRVKKQQMRIFADTTLITTYEIPQEKGNLVQHREFYEALRQDKSINKRKYAHFRPKKGRAKRTVSPTKAIYEMDINIRPVSAYEEAIVA
ncbi:MAG: integrase catalytic subunit [Candidatus Magnetoglobus multicellularis str. Araruama]|uniref:Integrase catalytic subunit n=1 Tax=Candidatus Magnetoglobus multicellularis str. Araruama TaxID=890399 RepID=A0A1V1NWL5_9BACT|nr:MAG: integrase catalytic subunit [Candidatus Magnetoglobus multicellularis str. Araruama]